PCQPLFPYTTLFRSATENAGSKSITTIRSEAVPFFGIASGAASFFRCQPRNKAMQRKDNNSVVTTKPDARSRYSYSRLSPGVYRSEEHTSELQSPDH